VNREAQRPPRVCDLCGLNIEQDRFLIHIPGNILHFCCEGCQGIYRILHQPEEVAEKEQQGG
jgi:ribosomal protein L24E